MLIIYEALNSNQNRCFMYLKYMEDIMLTEPAEREPVHNAYLVLTISESEFQLSWNVLKIEDEKIKRFAWSSQPCTSVVSHSESEQQMYQTAYAFSEHVRKHTGFKNKYNICQTISTERTCKNTVNWGGCVDISRAGCCHLPNANNDNRRHITRSLFSYTLLAAATKTTQCIPAELKAYKLHVTGEIKYRTKKTTRSCMENKTLKV